MSSDLVIRVRGAGKAYRMYGRPQDRFKQMLFGRFGVRYGREHWAVQEVNLEVGRGTTVGIIGRNGAGKSTLLQMIGGLLEPTTGDIVVNGRVAALIELGAGFNPEFTGRENVRLAASVLGLSRAEVEQRLPAILDFAAIGDFVDQPVKLYSSGMYARLAFAVAAHVDADLLIVDEILAVGDVAFAQKCMRFVREFKERGTLLFCSHDTAAVTNLCDEAIWLDRGTVRMRGPAKEVCHAYLAALSSEGDQPATFQTGGRRRAPAPTPIVPQAPSSNGQVAIPVSLDRISQRSGSPSLRIQEAVFLSEGGEPKSLWEGGERALVRITCEVQSTPKNPRFGFRVRDRLGQILFGDDTALVEQAPSDTRPGQTLAVRFAFEMPHLPPGDFALSAYVVGADERGPVLDDERIDAQFIRVDRTRSFGLVGTKLRNAEFRLVANGSINV
jgi:lipopolysaccharide transport system ATP-binding protein